MDTSFLPSQRRLEGWWSPLHARKSILDQHNNPTTHMHDLSSPTVLWHKVYGINPYPAMWSAMWGFAWEIIEACPAQPCKEGKGGTEGERRARKEGREAKPYRNQVGISNYSSTSAGSWMHGREAINNLPQSFPRPHRSTFHLHQPLILLLPASLYSITYGFSNAALSLFLSARDF